MSRIEINLGFANLIVEKNIDKNYNEFFVFLEDNEGGCFQDIAIIGQDYHYDKNYNVVNDKRIKVLVYADQYNEDYTHKFKINIYEGEKV